MTSNPRIPVGSTWTYKDVSYTVQAVADETLIQFEGQWTGIVTYHLTDETQREKNFVRSQVEFQRKFVRIA